MGRFKFPTIFSRNILQLPYSKPIKENLVHNPETQRDGFPNSIIAFFWRLFCRNKIDGGSRTEEEEKVYSWLYALARSEKDLVFEYVQSTERGLSFTEAQRRLKETGPNVPIDFSFPSWWHLLWVAFFHPFNIILIVLSALSYIASDGPNGCIMLVLVFISVTLRFYQEYSSSKAAMKLSEFVRCPIKVQRCAGRVVQTELVVQVDQRDVVPGDIVIFEPGDLFPGDVRLLSSKYLVVSQASLTGESYTTEKTADIKEDITTPLLDLKNICFMGTNVISGSGTGLVVSTGSKTYMSTMFSTMGKQRLPDDFEKGICCISYVVVTVILGVVIIIIVTADLSCHILSGSFLFGISVASALTPQMLPLIVNTCLAKGALAMAKDRCIVKSATAIRDMGSMDIICIDKTGTLTMNIAIMVNHIDCWGMPREKVLCYAFLNSYFKTDQKYPLDDAILAYVFTNGYRFQPSKWRKIDEIPFDFIRRRVSIILEMEVSENINQHFHEKFMVTKGALEEVLRVCSFVEHVDRGEITIFTPEDYQRILGMSEEISNEGLRVIGVATKRLKTKSTTESSNNFDTLESDMVFLGLITFFDPPKDSAKQALWRLAEKGVKAKVLTGDSLSLARKVCKEVGIETTHVVTGPELEQLQQETFHETVKKATVLARLTPTQKLRVVQSLQTVGGHIVGFLGDGINDSLALDAANVGISVDSGASVAKDFSDIILLEKDLNVLVAGVEHGRLTFGNTMKYIKMSVTANIGNVISLLIANLVLKNEPLTPRQLLTQNFLYSVGQIAIPWDKMEDDYVKIPQKWSERTGWYAKHPVLLGIELLNEPSAATVPLDTLVSYYRQGYQIVRKYSASAYVIVCQRIGNADPLELYQANIGSHNLVVDLHYYNLFDTFFVNMSSSDNIQFIYKSREAQLQALNNANGPLIFIGEWVNEWNVTSGSQTDYQDFGRAQLEVYNAASFGWVYWTLKNDRKHWDFEWNIRNNYLQLGKSANTQNFMILIWLGLAYTLSYLNQVL